MDEPGPSSRLPENPPASLQSLTGMRPATTAYEWQLQAILFRAKLTQYYNTFISQGGDDIDQIMQCDETEFLEIMSLVGMTSKPLHIRRLQRTLALFSQDRRKFLEESIPQIGEPPISRHEAFRLLIPGYHQPAAPPMFDPILYKHLMTQGASTSAIPASLFELFAVQLPQLQAPPLVPTLPITTIQQQRLSPLLPSTSAATHHLADITTLTETDVDKIKAVVTQISVPQT